ncbi:MAG: glycerol-3-phosphate 1-O-acyltransferase PlsY [Anaerofustis stercorihominis]|nr:glycerol-3-phosphate 1-O-acyltransferase PlsY [Anaerofustis stercorihominis]
MVKDIVLIIIAYLLGSLNAAILYSKFVKHDDIRNYGSGNAGATNTLRTYGFAVAFGVILFDVIKGIVAVLLAKHFSGSDFAVYCGGFAAVLGHNYPIFEGFKGGKGIAVSGGVSLAMDWRLGLIWICFGFAIVFATHIVSLGACISVSTTPFLAWYFIGTWPAVAYFTINALLCLYGHRGNIQRILNGTERKTYLRKRD